MKEARQQRHSCIIGVDANAVVGAQDPHDDRRVVGEWGYGVRNERGQIFVSWLHTMGLCAASTMFRKRPDFQWTHQLWSTGVLRQIDFVLVEKVMRRCLMDSYAQDELSGSSDHRSALAVVRTGSVAERGKRKNRRRQNPRSFEIVEFHRQLDICLRDGGL